MTDTAAKDRRQSTFAVRGREFNAVTCWLLGMAFAIVDAVTTWYAVTHLHIPEGNPVARWAISELGVLRAAALRVVVSAFVLGILAVGSCIELPQHRLLIRRSCQVILFGALTLWGIVAVSNVAQIVAVKVG